MRLWHCFMGGLHQEQPYWLLCPQTCDHYYTPRPPCLWGSPDVIMPSLFVGRNFRLQMFLVTEYFHVARTHTHTTYFYGTHTHSRHTFMVHTQWYTHNMVCTYTTQFYGTHIHALLWYWYNTHIHTLLWWVLPLCPCSCVHTHTHTLYGAHHRLSEAEKESNGAIKPGWVTAAWLVSLTHLGHQSRGGGLYSYPNSEMNQPLHYCSSLGWKVRH